DLCEVILKKIPVEIIELYPNHFNPSKRKPYDTLKFLLDITLSSVFLFLLTPALIIIALVILIEDGWPVVFSQTRVGKNGKPFKLLKFRSMKQCNYNEKDPNCNIEERLLKSGRIIRKIRLDEILQFFNVLKGDMSIIGPRPEMVHYHEKADKEIPFYQYRLSVKPGITGWAQVSYMHTTSIDEYREKTAYDFYYTKNRSFFLDLKILLKTVDTVLRMKGSR
ncbi:MAG: sugar transferase, partial [Spirochaetota bacterium]